MDPYEKKIIGGIANGLVLPSTLGLYAADFDNEDLGITLAIATQLETEGVEIEPEILATRLAETDTGFYSARDFVLMAQSVKSLSVVFDAVDKVKARTLKSFLTEKVSSLAVSEKTGAEMLDALRKVVLDAERSFSSSENSFIYLKDIAVKLKAVYGDLLEGISYAVPTGFTQIDKKLLDGYSKGDLHLIVGMTGAGKSAMALNHAMNQAKAGVVVGAVSREMSDIENMMRLQCSDTRIERYKIRSRMDRDIYDELIENLDKMSRYPIAFDVQTEDIETLRPRVARMVDQDGMGILYVDYLQLMSSKFNADTRANEVQAVSRELKKLAMEFKIPVVALCQFNNGVLNASLFDVMNYIRESGSVKQDASTIQYVQIEHTDEPIDMREAKDTVLKNRNGETFVPVHLMYHGPIFQFYEQDSPNL